jgi:hypothetical protein
MIRAKRMIEKKKEEAYKMLQLPTLSDMLPNLTQIGREVFNIKEQVGYAEDVHAMFVNPDDEYVFVGFVGDHLSDDSMLQTGDGIWVVDDDESYEVFINPITFQDEQLEECESVFHSDCYDNVSFGKNSYREDTVFLSCYWLYMCYLESINFSERIEKAVNHFE